MSDKPAAAPPARKDDEIREIPHNLAADFVPPTETPSEITPEDADADPYLRGSVEAQQAFDRAVAEAEGGDAEDAVRHFLRASKLAEDAREWYLAAVACRRVGDLLRIPGSPYDVDRAFRMYRRAVAAYERCGLFQDAREVAYQALQMRLRRAGQFGLPWRERAELFLYWLVAGFGQRPLRVIAASAVIVFAFALLYWAAGGVVPAAPASARHDFWEALYFSGITFATVGYGDFVPAPHVRLLALAEGALGVSAISFFVVVLANRLRH